MPKDLKIFSFKIQKGVGIFKNRKKDSKLCCKIDSFILFFWLDWLSLKRRVILIFIYWFLSCIVLGTIQMLYLIEFYFSNGGILIETSNIFYKLNKLLKKFDNMKLFKATLAKVLDCNSIRANRSYSEPIWNLFPNHSEQIGKTFCISFVDKLSKNFQKSIWQSDFFPI